MSTSKDHSSTSHTTAVENQANNLPSSEIFIREHIEGTPFEIITTTQETFLALGRYRITRPGFTAENYRQIVIEKEWALLLDVIGICQQITF